MSPVQTCLCWRTSSLRKDPTAPLKTRSSNERDRQGALSCRCSWPRCSSRSFLKPRLSILNLAAVGGWRRAGRCPFQELVSSKASPCSGVISAGPESGLDLCLSPGNVCQGKAGHSQSQASPKSRLQPHGDGNWGWELGLCPQRCLWPCARAWLCPLVPLPFPPCQDG